ncbi:MAG: hypothetical protein RMZ41_002785 [Nostoc sp. DedVER02]|uniref:5'-methylthioadenosine/S-adenosylhomocysteine nucleosidase family protein n=1 Tax=unclassified Nostoc TaxID=2593658 RepID=UPI002AD2DCCE|nr:MULTISPECIES: hypothetical protein [unclassified Nostoc]MDZ7986915.1 hypothetical protein [Nostoc sp. DedVER02]MDZ8115817.1 hypothetical protein [Nostoc sp. DedVER01b]
MPCAVILTAITEEYMAVRAHLTDIQQERHPTTQTIYERGNFSSNGQLWQVGIVEIGAGNANAGVEVERAITYFKPVLVCFVGVAGGLKDVALGDVVAATKVYGYESGKVIDTTFLPRPSVGMVSYRLEQIARFEGKQGDWLKRIKDDNEEATSQPKIFVGAIAAGDKVVASTNSETYRLLKSNYGDALAVEMESYGILNALRAYPKIDGLIIRGISDLIDNKSDADSKGHQKIASRHASAFAFEILAKFAIDKTNSTSPLTTIGLSKLKARLQRKQEELALKEAQFKLQQQKIDEIERRKNLTNILQKDEYEGRLEDLRQELDRLVEEIELLYDEIEELAEQIGNK